MEDRRYSETGPWRGWLFSLLLGMALAFVCLTWLNRRAASPPMPDLEGPETTAQSQQDSVGFEFSLRFRILLPQGKEK